MAIQCLFNALIETKMVSILNVAFNTDTTRKTTKHAATKKAIQKAYMIQRCRTHKKKLLRRSPNSKKRKGKTNESHYTKPRS